MAATQQQAPASAGKKRKRLAYREDGCEVRAVETPAFSRPDPARRGMMEQWVVKVPFDFDEDELDGLALSRVALIGAQGAAGSAATGVRVGEGYRLEIDDKSAMGAQLQALVPSATYRNGLRLGPRISRSFSVSLVPEQADEDEHGSGSDGDGDGSGPGKGQGAEGERLRKVHEVVQQLKRKRRRQISMAAVPSEEQAEDVRRRAEEAAAKDNRDDDARSARKKKKKAKKDKKKKQR